MRESVYRSIASWKSVGVEIAARYRSNMWLAGDWLNEGRKQFGASQCRAVLEAHGWSGLSYDTIKVYASIARRFPPPLRYLKAEAAHYQTVAPLADDVAMALLQQAVNERWSVNRLRITVRRIRFFRDLNGTDVVKDIETLIRQERKFRGILVDPPWDWEVTEGKAGSSGAYYPKMTDEELDALRVAEIATDDAMLFMWSPAAAILRAAALMQIWGFTYHTHSVWDKDTGGYGLGNYWRMTHEDLMLGLRPGTQRGFDDRDMSSMMKAKRSRNHSEKPPIFHKMVERAIAGPYLELFGRRAVTGWTVIGNQLDGPDDQSQLLAAN